MTPITKTNGPITQNQPKYVVTLPAKVAGAVPTTLALPRLVVSNKVLTLVITEGNMLGSILNRTIMKTKESIIPTIAPELIFILL